MAQQTGGGGGSRGSLIMVVVLDLVVVGAALAWAGGPADRSPPVATPDAGPPDAGPEVVDAGSRCDGLSLPACLAAHVDCAPVYDDRCCPGCEQHDSCADCLELVYHHCAPRDLACGSGTCGRTPPWACEDNAPDCAAAHPMGDRCDLAGCVPAITPRRRRPRTTCVAVSPVMCTVTCGDRAPRCPDDTVPEGDGTCYTGRCIPDRLCN